MVRVAGGGEGRWDSHSHSAETVIVWSGDFVVEFRDHTLTLSPGQCCVVPAGAEHRGTSRNGAEVRAVQRCRVDRVESAPPQLRGEARRLIARGMFKPGNV